MDTTEKAKVAKKWTEYASGDVSHYRDIMWTGNVEVTQRIWSMQTRGAGVFWPTYCVQKFLANPIATARMASFGCGMGDLERHLARLNSFSSCDAYDISPGSIKKARQSAADSGMTTINYILSDLESNDLPENTYDAAWFNASLHHIQELEAVCENVAGSIRPDGHLFFNEYIGPNRFDFPERQKEAMRGAFALIPEKFRRSFIPAYPHEFLAKCQMPDPVKIEAADPSEAIRSADIMRVVSDHFEIVEQNNYGGTLLQYVLNGIAGNFRADDPESLIVLEMLYNIEDALIEAGDLEAAFTVVVAKPKQ